MLRSEQQYVESQLGKLTETQQDRKQAMRERALRLRAEREEERKRIVMAKEDQRFREACPQLHEKQSKLRENDCASEQEYQMQLRKKEEEEIKRQEAEFAKVWEADRLAKERRHEQDIERAKALVVEEEKIRAQQLVERQKIREREEAERAKEAEEQLRQYEREAEIAAKKQAEIVQLKDKAAQQFARFNVEQEARKKEIIAKEREEDMKVVNAILEKGREQDRIEAEQKAEYIRGIREYRAQLAQQLEKEKISEAHLDKMMRDEQDREWNKRQEQWEKERLAREELNKEVFEARSEQLRQKQLRKEQEKIEAIELQKYVHERNNQVAALEKMEALEAKKHKDHFAEYLNWQIAQREYQKDNEKAEKIEEIKMEKKAEQDFQKRMEHTLQGANSYEKNYGRKKIPFL
eukprot:TRINITY_DN1460_c0_g1_i1.p1 TRINITY_DN1460_c0_g1~~TRINITY_DN1460_c0_g1_i1.p1  ORF type:complete len:407 (+),score=168.70 TRINITY_DN1460_c0_g1_i1:530-1750(+)